MVNRAAFGYLRDAAQAVSLFCLTFYFSAVAWSLLPVLIGLRSDVVLTGSMEPRIHPGDIVVTFPMNPKKIRPGMIISFTDPSEPDRNLIHRMIARNDDGTIVTRGDANPSADSTPVPLRNVHGQSRIRIPWIGLPMVWEHEKRYRPLLIFLGTLCVLVVLAGRRLEDDDEEEEPEAPPAGEGEDEVTEVIPRLPAPLMIEAGPRVVEGEIVYRRLPVRILASKELVPRYRQMSQQVAVAAITAVGLLFAFWLQKRHPR